MLDVLPQFALVVRLPDVVDAPVDGALEDERAHDNAEGEGGGAFRDASVEGPRQRHGFAWGVLQAMRACYCYQLIMARNIGRTTNTAHQQ